MSDTEQAVTVSKGFGLTARRVGEVLETMGYETGNNLMRKEKPSERNSYTLLARVGERRCFGLFAPELVCVGLLQMRSEGERKVKGDEWVLEVYGTSNLKRLVSDAGALASAFKVKVHVRHETAHPKVVVNGRDG